MIRRHCRINMASSIGKFHAPAIALILVFFAVQTLCSKILLEKGTIGMLPCEVEGAACYVQWNKGDQPVIVFILQNGEWIKRGSDISRYNITSNYSLLIHDVEIGDESEYSSFAYDSNGRIISINQWNVTVFAHSTLTFTWENTRVDSSAIVAKCDALGARPAESISWFINDQEVTEGITETTAENQLDSALTDTFSELAYPPAINHTSISCSTGGHTLTIYHIYKRHLSAPSSVTIDISNDGSIVTCKIPPGEEGDPPASYYQITGDAIEHESFTGVNFASADTEFICVAGNYIGNVTATANLPAVLAHQTTSGSVKDQTTFGGFLASSWPPITNIQHTAFVFRADLWSPAVGNHSTPSYVPATTTPRVSPVGYVAGIAVSAGLFAISVIINIVQYYGRNRKPGDGSLLNSHVRHNGDLQDGDLYTNVPATSSS